MRYVHNCKRCQKQFETNKITHVFCSRTCSNIQYKENLSRDRLDLYVRRKNLRRKGIDPGPVGKEHLAGIKHATDEELMR